MSSPYRDLLRKELQSVLATNSLLHICLVEHARDVLVMCCDVVLEQSKTCRAIGSHEGHLSSTTIYTTKLNKFENMGWKRADQNSEREKYTTW